MRFADAAARGLKKRLLPGLLALFAITAAALIGYGAGFTGPLGALSGLNAYLYDASLALLKKRDSDAAWPNTFILLIDQASLDQPPWSTTPRALQHPQLARLGRDAFALGARKVGYDLVLALDPAGLDIAGVDLNTYDAPLRSLLEQEADRVVIGAYPTVQPAQAYSDIVGSAGVGVVDLQSEDDGIARSIASRLRLSSGNIVAGFAELVAGPTGGEMAIRAQPRFLLFPRAPLRSAPFIPVSRFQACLATPGGAEKLRAQIAGRNVLIGSGIPGEDLRRGPDRFMPQPPIAPRPSSADPCAPSGLDIEYGERNVVPGVFLQAAGVESAMAADTPRLAEAWQRALMSAAAAGMALVFFNALARRLTRLPARRPAFFSTSAVAFASVVGAILALVAAFMAIEVGMMRFAHLWIPLGNTLGFVSALGLLITMSLAVRRDLALADLRASFGRYLPAKLVAAALARNETAGGEEREISVLFADLRGFTGYCASRSGEPAAIMQALNAKFGAAQIVLDRHEGTLDKFDGDAVIAFWNGVEDQPDHAARALAAAIEIIEGDADDPSAPGELHFKAAVATGLAFVGSYGSKQKMNFSAIGEPMNLAARLEGLCNEYGVSLLVSETTIAAIRKQASNDPEIREVLERSEIFRLGSTQLKGYAEEFTVMSVRRKEGPGVSVAAAAAN